MMQWRKLLGAVLGTLAGAGITVMAHARDTDAALLGGGGMLLGLVIGGLLDLRASR